MKKLFALFALLAIIVLSTATLFAQSDTTGTGGGTGSADPLELIFLIFGDYNWFWTIGYGMIAALTANGMADTSMIQAILKAIAAKGKF